MSDAAATTTAADKKKKTATIIVNAEEKTVDDETVTFDQVTTLAYPTPPYPDTLYTVTYRDAHEPKEGRLVAGQTVVVKKKGTVFNVKASDKS